MSKVGINVSYPIDALSETPFSSASVIFPHFSANGSSDKFSS